MFTEPRRRLAAILCADVAGYSRLMGDDEADTVAALESCRDIFRREVAAHEGRVVDTAGDSVLAIFDSVVEAIEASTKIQDEIEDINAERPEHRHMRFRIGINLGDILQQTDGSVYGDGVNIAARLQTFAQPGGLTVAGQAYDFIADRNDECWYFLGEQEVKNIARPVRVYEYRCAANASPLDAEPQAATPSASTGTDSRRLPSRPSIAVLPFNNMTGNAEDEYFADGITEDVITELSRFRDLIVTSRNSTFAYKGQALKAQDIGAELNVRYILEGSVRKAGERVRVNAQLIDGESGHHLWAERFDRKLEDVFDVQDELTRRIVATLIGRLEDTERQRARTDSAGQDPQAYDLVLKGRELWLKFNREDNLAARGLYLQAIKLDPNYARPYSSIAWTYAMAYNEYWTDDPQGSLDKALDYAQRAVHMDPSAHSFRLCLGMVYFFRRDLDRAIECFEKAIELNVNDADCYTFLSQALAINGEPEKSIELLEHAFEINPYMDDWSKTLYVAAHFVAHRYERAAQIIEDIHSPQVSACRWFAATCAALGRHDEARRYVEKYLERYPEFDLEDHVNRVPFRRTADREHYEKWMREAGFADALCPA